MKEAKCTTDDRDFLKTFCKFDMKYDRDEIVEKNIKTKDKK